MRLIRALAALLRRLRIRAALRRLLQAHARPGGAPVLIWDLGNFPGIVGRNGLFATALRLRGRPTHTILCDGTPVACIRRGIEQPERLGDWPRRCPGCLSQARRVAEQYRLEYSLVGDYVDAPSRARLQEVAAALPLRDIASHVLDGAQVGRMAWSSLTRHMKGTLLDADALSPEHETLYRRYLYAAMVNVHAAGEAIRRRAPASVLASHGVYVDYAPAMSVAWQRGVPAMSWSSAYADAHHYFTVPKGANELLLQGVSRAELWQERAAQPLSGAEEARLDGFLHRRYHGAAALDIRVLAAPETPGALRARLGLRAGRRVFAVFPHVNWDASFDMSAMLYPDANQWTLDTLRCIASLTEVDWIVRLHPGELTDGSVVSTGRIIEEQFGVLPAHVKLLPADSTVNSLGLFQLVDGGATIFSTAGLELAALGKPAILAGHAHYGGKGFTIDAGSTADYREALGRAATLAPLSAEQTALARRYAYWYFVQRQIPVNAVDRRGGHWGDADPACLDSLLPGRDPVMDRLCDGILHGRDLIMPSEELPPA